MVVLERASEVVDQKLNAKTLGSRALVPAEQDPLNGIPWLAETQVWIGSTASFRATHCLPLEDDGSEHHFDFQDDPASQNYIDSVRGSLERRCWARPAVEKPYLRPSAKEVA